MLTALWRERYDSKQCRYVGHCARLVVEQDSRESKTAEMLQQFYQQPQIPMHTPAHPVHCMFPAFETRGVDGYNGIMPSRSLLESFFVTSVQGDAPWTETLMALNADTDIMSADDSYKVTKRMSNVRGVKICHSLFTVLNNRTNCVILQVLTTGKGLGAETAAMFAMPWRFDPTTLT
jgi:hypothetical protein